MLLPFLIWIKKRKIKDGQSYHISIHYHLDVRPTYSASEWDIVIFLVTRRHFSQMPTAPCQQSVLRRETSSKHIFAMGYYTGSSKFNSGESLYSKFQIEQVWTCLRITAHWVSTWQCLDISWDPCTGNSKFNRFEHVQGSELGLEPHTWRDLPPLSIEWITDRHDWKITFPQLL